MKSLLILVLGITIALEGCYSYSAVVGRAPISKTFPPDDKGIRLTMKNGSVIESDAQKHVVVTEPSSFIYGKGNSTKYRDTAFVGRIDTAAINITKERNDGGVRRLRIWLKDSSQVVFLEGSYFVVMPDQGTGLWCIGEKSSVSGDSAFAGKIDLSYVKQIDIQKYSDWNFLIGPLVGAVSGLILAAISEDTYTHQPGKMHIKGLGYIIGPPLGLLAGLIVAAMGWLLFQL